MSLQSEPRAPVRLWVGLIVLQSVAATLAIASPGPLALTQLLALPVAARMGVRSSVQGSAVRVAAPVSLIGLVGPLSAAAVAPGGWSAAVAILAPFLLAADILRDARWSMIALSEKEEISNRRVQELRAWRVTHDIVRTAQHAAREVRQVSPFPLGAHQDAALASALAELEAAEARVFRRYSTSEARAGASPGTARGRRTLPDGVGGREGGFTGMRLFGDVRNTWSVLPRPLAEAWARVGDVLDAVRLLHTRRIEWLSLLATLWLRAALVAAAPTLAHWPGAGVAPALPVGDPADGVWLAAALYSAATALIAPWIVARAEDPGAARMRRNLLGVELPIAIAVIGLSPSWATAAFSVGVVNWAQRPVWRSSVLVAYATGLAVVLATSLLVHGARLGPVLVETLVAITVCFLVSCSYGLILTVTLSALVSIPARRARSRRRAWLEGRAVARAADSVLQAARSCLAADGGSQEPDAHARADETLRRARASVLDEGRVLRSPWRRAVQFQDVLADAVWGVLPKVDPELGDRPSAYTPEVVPRELAGAELTRRGSRALLRLTKLAALEVARHGEGPMRTEAILVPGRGAVELSFTNRCRPDRRPGRGTGREAIREAVGRLPGGEIVEHGEHRGSAGVFVSGPVMILRVRFEPSAFRRRVSVAGPGSLG